MKKINNTFCYKPKRFLEWQKGNLSDLENSLTDKETPLTSKEKDDLPAFGFAKRIGTKKNEQLFPTNFIILEVDRPSEIKDQIKEGNKELEKEWRAKFRGWYEAIKNANELNFYIMYLTASMIGLRFILKLDKPIYDAKEYEDVVQYFLNLLLPFEITKEFHDIRINQFWYVPTFKKYFLKTGKTFFFSEKKEKKQVENTKKKDKTLKKRVFKAKKQKNDLEKERKIIAEIFSFLSKKKKSITRKYNDWIKVGYGLINTFPLEEAQNYFFIFSELDKDKFNEEECLKQFQQLFRGKPDGEKINFGSIIHLAREQGFPKKNRLYKEMNKKYGCKKFWKVTKQRGEFKITLIPSLFCEFINSLGFYYLSNGLNQRFPIVHISDNIIKETTTKIIKDNVISQIELFDKQLLGKITKGDLKNKLMNGANNYFGIGNLEFIPKVDFVQQKDIAKLAYVPYNNGVVEVSKERIKLLSYKEILGQYWGTQIIKREFTLLNDTEQESVFEKLVDCICEHDNEKSLRLKCIIGSLLHTFKDPSQPLAVIFMDETDMVEYKVGKANGGTGKSLIATAIGHIRKMHLDDGKNFDCKHKFKFQQINRDTQVFLIDDVLPQFQIEKLYPAISSVLVVEKKNKDAISIPFEDSPKILITTNYTLLADGGISFKRRAVVFEFSHYFNDKNTPLKKFGHRFFSEWDNEEWNKFDNFMVKCLQLYLDKGIPKATISFESPLNKFKYNYDNDLIDFANNVISPLVEADGEKEFDKKVLYLELLADNPRFQEGFAQKTFTSFLKKWAVHRKYEVDDRKSNSASYISFKVIK